MKAVVWTFAFVGLTLLLLVSYCSATTALKIPWTASTPAPGSSGVFGYNIYRCTGAACTPTVKVGSSSTNTYFDTATVASTTYCYAVSSFDENLLESAKSSPGCKLTLAYNTLTATTNSAATSRRR